MQNRPLAQGARILQDWLNAAIDYIPRWVAHQVRLAEQPGCSFALALHGKVVCEFASAMPTRRRARS
jgi:hypothetical protein